MLQSPLLFDASFTGTLALTGTSLALIASAYLLGSISSAVLLSRAFGLEDPRRHGSGNPGATNVWRSGSRPAAILTFIADLLKGAVPVWLALALEQPPTTAALCGLAAMLGHLWPLFFQFRGGKGVATFLGACLAIKLPLALAQMSLWLLVVLLSRRSSLASLCAALATLPLAYQLQPDILPVVAIMVLLLIVRHHSNIRKLLDGRESRL